MSNKLLLGRLATAILNLQGRCRESQIVLDLDNQWKVQQANIASENMLSARRALTGYIHSTPLLLSTALTFKNGVYTVRQLIEQVEPLTAVEKDAMCRQWANFLRHPLYNGISGKTAVVFVDILPSGSSCGFETYLPEKHGELNSPSMKIQLKDDSSLELFFDLPADIVDAIDRIYKLIKKGK